MPYLVTTAMELAAQVPMAPFGSATAVLSVAFDDLEDKGWRLVQVANEQPDVLYIFWRPVLDED